MCENAWLSNETILRRRVSKAEGKSDRVSFFSVPAIREFHAVGTSRLGLAHKHAHTKPREPLHNPIHVVFGRHLQATILPSRKKKGYPCKIQSISNVPQPVQLKDKQSQVNHGKQIVRKSNGNPWNLSRVFRFSPKAVAKGVSSHIITTDQHHV